MVSNKSRKTPYKDLSVKEYAYDKFNKLMKDGETQTDTLLRIMKGMHKSKRLDQTAQA